MRYIPLLLAFPIVLAFGCSTPVEDQPTMGATKVQAMPAGPGRRVNVVVQDYHFVPDEITAKPGEKLHLVVTNMGQNEHNLNFDLPEGAVQMPSDVYPGKSMEYDIVVPKQTGKYYFHCPVGNHYSRGMVGDLLVK
jgi:uncharacterized cupredoxin-like copper-binding protein